MTATVTDAQTLSDLAEATAWAKTHGAFWFAETAQADDGTPYLTLTTPYSLIADGSGSPVATSVWVIAREPGGVILQMPASAETRGPLPTLADALAVVEAAEQAHAKAVGMTEPEQEAAAAWAQRQGKGWGVEPFYADDGTASLGIFAPHRWDDMQGDDEYVFIISRDAEGVALIETLHFDPLGVFDTVAAALDRAAAVVQEG